MWRNLSLKLKKPNLTLYSYLNIGCDGTLWLKLKKSNLSAKDPRIGQVEYHQIASWETESLKMVVCCSAGRRLSKAAHHTRLQLAVDVLIDFAVRNIRWILLFNKKSYAVAITDGQQKNRRLPTCRGCCWIPGCLPVGASISPVQNSKLQNNHVE